MAKGREIVNADGIGCCSALKGLDMSNNSLESLEVLRAAASSAVSPRPTLSQGVGDCKELRHLNVSQNRLQDLNGLEGLTNLEGSIVRTIAPSSCSSLILPPARFVQCSMQARTKSHVYLGSKG